MKKTFYFFIVCLLLINILGCTNNHIPEDMSYDSYKTGIKVLEIVDQYFERQLNRKEANRCIGELMSEFKGSGIGDIEIKQEAKQIQLSFYVNEITLLKARDELAKNLGKEK
jgi:hypothetical protein